MQEGLGLRDGKGRGGKGGRVVVWDGKGRGGKGGRVVVWDGKDSGVILGWSGKGGS